MTLEEVLTKMRSANTLAEWDEAWRIRLSYSAKSQEEADTLAEYSGGFIMRRGYFEKMERENTLAQAS